MDIEINDLSQLGVIRDISGHQLPPEAFTLGRNIRVVPDGIARMPGWARAWESLTTTAPIFIVQVRSATGELWWVYGTATALQLIDDAPALTDLSGAAYSASYWQATQLGSIPILNNGTDDPQSWDLNPANNFQDLPDWPASTSCRVIRAFGPFLVAMNLSVSGTNRPHLVRWSHPADPGTLPASWDITDVTRDAGEIDLVDTESGGIVDGRPLRGAFVIYKERSTWLMRVIGGQQIMQFDQFLSSAGVMNRECVQATGDGAYHFVVTEDDILIHDATSAPVSVLDRRFRSYLFNQINGEYRHLNYVFANPRQREMWFCYVSQGSSVVDSALIWSYGAGGERGVLYEADYPFPWTALGDITDVSDIAWEDEVGDWDDAYGAWNTSDLRRPIGVSTSGNRFAVLDTAALRDGATFLSVVERQGLALVGRTRMREPIVDFKKRKMIRRVWPKLLGGPIDVEVGGQETPDGVVDWGTPIVFDPQSGQRYVDLTVDGFAVGVRFSSSRADDWLLHGYTMELAQTGRF